MSDIGNNHNKVEENNSADEVSLQDDEYLEKGHTNAKINNTMMVKKVLEQQKIKEMKNITSNSTGVTPYVVLFLCEILAMLHPSCGEK